MRTVGDMHDHADTMQRFLPDGAVCLQSWHHTMLRSTGHPRLGMPDDRQGGAVLTRQSGNQRPAHEACRPRHCEQAHDAASPIGNNFVYVFTPTPTYIQSAEH
jgi:hypothetical protein